MAKNNDEKVMKSNKMEFIAQPLLKALSKKIWLMVLVGVVLAVLSYGATKLFVAPTYRCGFTAYVNNQQAQEPKDSLTNTDLNARRGLVRTYSEILKSYAVLNGAAESIGMENGYNTLKGLVSTEIKDDTEIICVYVVSKDPHKAYVYADAIAKTAPGYMKNIVEGSSMKIVDYPLYSDRRYKPSYLMYAAFGFIFGVLLVAVYVTIKYFRDDTVKDEGDLETRFSMPILGVIPDVNKSASEDSSYYEYESYESSAKSASNRVNGQKQETEEEKKSGEVNEKE